MESWLTIGGLIVTFGLGIYNLSIALRNARRTSIVELITAHRLKWSLVIQDLVGSFCGAVYYCCFSAVEGSDEERKKIEEIERLRHLIPLNLCEGTPIEERVEKLVGDIFSMCFERPRVPAETLRDALLELVKHTQALLKDNWKSVGREAEQGILTDRLGAANETPQ